MPRKHPEKLSQPPAKAKEIFQIVRLLPANFEFKDCYSIYCQIVEADNNLKTGERRIIAIKYNFDYKTQFSDERIDWRLYESLNLTHREFVFVNSHVLGEYLLNALQICLHNLPQMFVDYVGMPQWNDKYLYLVAKESGFCARHQITSLNSYIEFVKKESIVPSLLFYGYGACRAFDRFISASDYYERLYNLARIAESEKFVDFFEHSLIRDDVYIFDNVRVKIINGRFEFETDQFTNAFRGVLADRIKLCETCGRVFWVSRKSMTGCTKECMSVLSTRRWREKDTKKWSEKTTPEQRERYKINKIIKENKENGSL